MATLQQIQTFVDGNPTLKQRFKAARIQVAWNIQAEAGTTTNHAARAVWATKILTDPLKDIDKEYNWFLSNANVQSLGESVTDAQVVSGVGALVDAWA